MRKSRDEQDFLFTIGLIPRGLPRTKKTVIFGRDPKYTYT